MKKWPIISMFVAGAFLSLTVHLMRNGAPTQETPASATRESSTQATSPAAEESQVEPHNITPLKSTPENGVKWRDSLESAMAEAKISGKPIMIDFYADWCQPCKMLDKAYEQPAFIAETKQWIPVKIDADQNQLVIQTYNAGSLPTIVFLDSDGNEINRKVGFSVPESVKDEAGLTKHLTQDMIKTMRASTKKKL